MKRAALLLLFLAACGTPEETAHARLTRFVDRHQNPEWNAAEKKEAHRLARAYLDLPRRDHRDWTGFAYAVVWYALKDDPAADRSELLRTTHGLEEYARSPRRRFIEPARVLAERDVDLDYAEHLARRGIVEAHRWFQRRPEVSRAFMAGVVGDAHESLGIVLQKRGRRGEAEQELAAAAALKRFAGAK